MASRLAQYGEWEIEQRAQQGWSDPDCQLFAWVRHPEVEATNNGTERALRPYVVKRKISGGHRTWAGAWKHAILC